MREHVRELGITLGEKCNFRCRHCSSDFQAPRELSSEEINTIRVAIKSHQIRSILLSGGEPTLYVAKANRLLDGLPGLEKFHVRMTTNGHFATSVNAAKTMLRSFVMLTSVQISYDRYHAEFLPIENVANLGRACEDLGIGFSISSCVSNPLDLAVLAKLREFGSFHVGVQKVLPVGAAEKNDLGYKHPAFDAAVLAKSCPRKGKLIYLGGCGFTICCSSLIFLDNIEKFSHPTMREHFESRFYKLISQKTFGEIADSLKVPCTKLLPAHSDPCTLCAYLFSQECSNEA